MLENIEQILTHSKKIDYDILFLDNLHIIQVILTYSHLLQVEAQQRIYDVTKVSSNFIIIFTKMLTHLNNFGPAEWQTNFLTNGIMGSKII